MNSSQSQRLFAGGVSRSICALVLAAAALPAPVFSQGREATVPPPAPQDQATADPLDRGTPRGAVRGFLLSCREGNYERAAQYLDLSQVDGGDRPGRGGEIARQLKFLLDQDKWIDLDSISDAPDGNASDQLPPNRELVTTIRRESGDFAVYLDRTPREDGVLVWRVAASTVARVPSLYADLGLPAIVDALPRPFLTVRFLEIALWQWVGLILLVAVAWVIGWVGSTLLARTLHPLTARSKSDIDDRLLTVLLGPARLLLAVAAFNGGVGFLRLSVPANDFAHHASKFIVIAGFAWAVLRSIDLFATVVKERFVGRGQASAANLVPFGARTIKVVVFLLTALATLDTFGFDVTALLAGLGVGGLAVALAAQKTVENVFGGVSVIVDQPVRPGDFCRFGDKMGVVEDIGLRSTRIRTLDRTLLSVPNAEFSNLQIENFGARDRIRLLATFGLRYETTPDQLRHVMAGLRRVLIAHPKVLPDPLRVRFVGFGAYSLDLEAMTYIDTKDINEFLAVREDIFLRFMDVIAESGTGFAFPSNTTYLTRDRGLDASRQQSAEAAIARLRSEGKLMYPDFSPEDVKALDDTLDWPPKGSVSSRPS